MDLGLKGKIAIITGGTDGIGKAAALIFAKEGAKVAICARTQANLDKTAAEIKALGAEVLAVSADMAKPADIQRFMDAVVKQFGGIDILVNNAGLSMRGKFLEITDDKWHEDIELKVFGAIRCCRLAIPHMKKRGGGFIINISSLAGKNPFVDGAAYCASKAGLNAFSEVLMQELRHDDIRVSYVLPGSVATEFVGGDASKGADWKIGADEVADVVIGLLHHHPRSLPSRVELRPSKPKK